MINGEAEVVERVGQALGAWDVVGFREAEAVEGDGVGFCGRGSMASRVVEVEVVVPEGGGLLSARASRPGIV